MYKIKLFRNMSGLTAGQSLRQVITNKDWWKGVFGNMFSTMLGIALTVGVAALVEHHNDKKLSREMMFNVIRTADENVGVIECIDSLCHIQKKSIIALEMINGWTDSEISELSDTTLQKILDEAIIMEHQVLIKSTTDKYFFSPQMMHQFDNPEKYTRFATYIQFDKQSTETLEQLRQEAIDLRAEIVSLKMSKHMTSAQVTRELFDNQHITRYYSHLKSACLGWLVKEYKRYFKLLLKTMGATQEEYDEYVKENPVEEISDEDEAAEKQTDKKQK